MNKARIIIIAGLLLIAAGCNKKTAGYDDGFVLLANQQVEVAVADNAKSRDLGLGGRPQMDDFEGMWFIFDRPDRYEFWMKGMSFPIDIVWVSNNRVVDITRNAQPQPGAADSELRLYQPTDSVDRVLEVHAGWANRYGLKVGDKVEFKRR